MEIYTTGSQTLTNSPCYYFCHSSVSSTEAADLDNVDSAMSDIDQMMTLPDKSSVDESVVASEDIVNIMLPPWAIRAGARRTIYHEPCNTIAAIVTCGRLCPGINDVSE